MRGGFFAVFLLVKYSYTTIIPLVLFVLGFYNSGLALMNTPGVLLTPVPVMSSPLKQAQELVFSELAQVRSLLLQKLPQEPKIIATIGREIVLMGKKIRPLLLLLCAKACAKTIHNQHLLMAAAIEYLHIASLLHDDVLDNAHYRHHKKTINMRWNNHVAVLVGDVFYTLSCELMLAAQAPETQALLIQTTKDLALGELLQTECSQQTITEALYLNILELKTARLFATTMRGAAMLSNAVPAYVSAFSAFGLSFGMIFQLVDDILDFSPLTTAKDCGNDWACKKITLPILYGLKYGSKKTQTSISNALLLKDPLTIAAIRKLVFCPMFKTYANSLLSMYTKRACAALATLPLSQEIQVLKNILYCWCEKINGV